MRGFCLLCLLCLLWLARPLSAAETADSALILNSCATCHSATAGIPALPHHQADAILTQLHALRDGENTVMHRLLADLSAEELQAIARQLAATP
ncbi:MAG: hypothetical protein KDI36_10100 [Pseudomonadales bacterium]|nr:hypothetical protein [Pseudomonadales bacterium]